MTSSISSGYGRATALFLALLLLFSSAAYALIIHLHKETAMLSRFIMWCPGTAALVACAICRVPRATLGWRWPATRWLVFAYAVPIGYAVPVYAIAWLALPGSMASAEFQNATSAQYGLGGAPALATALVGVPLLATVGMLSGLTWALGEEIGWRGFLLPRLSGRLGFAGACAASGLLWAAWHYPGLLWADYNAGTDPRFAVACFTVSVVGMSFVLGWLRLRTASVWPCALMHASHNLFIQGVFDPLTSDVGHARLVTSEFGIGLAVTIWSIAAVLLYRFPVDGRKAERRRGLRERCGKRGDGLQITRAT